MEIRESRQHDREILDQAKEIFLEKNPHLSTHDFNKHRHSLSAIKKNLMKQEK